MPIHADLYQEMIGAFKFNDKSSQDFGLVCKSVKRPILPAPKLRMVEIGGRSGAYALPTKHYELLHLTVKLQYIGDLCVKKEDGTVGRGIPKYPYTLNPMGIVIPDFYELRKKARAIAEWLVGTGEWRELVFDDEPDVKYSAQVEGEVELNLEIDQYPFGVSEVNFVAQPIIPGINLDIFKDIVLEP